MCIIKKGASYGNGSGIGVSIVWHSCDFMKLVLDWHWLFLHSSWHSILRNEWLSGIGFYIVLGTTSSKIGDIMELVLDWQCLFPYSSWQTILRNAWIFVIGSRLASHILLLFLIAENVLGVEVLMVVVLRGVYLKVRIFKMRCVESSL